MDDYVLLNVFYIWKDFQSSQGIGGQLYIRGLAPT